MNDLSSMIKKLSLLASVTAKPISKDTGADDDDFDDDDDDEEEEEAEEEVDSDDNKENENGDDVIEIKPPPGDAQRSMSKQCSFRRLSSSGSSSSSIVACDVSRNSSANFYQTREAKTSGSNLINIKETDERSSNSFDDDISVINEADNSHSAVSNSTAMPFSTHLSIQTEFLGTYNNHKSPRAQVIELGNQLELEKAENLKLKDTLTKLKSDLETRIKELNKQNLELKDELNFNKRLVKEIKGSADTSQLDNYRNEIRTLNERLASVQTANAQLKSQVEKLGKYEQAIKDMNIVDINQKTYQLLGRIGQGGFSEVFHCIALSDSKSYALKRVDLSLLDTDNVSAVMNEIQLLQRLQSTQKVVQLFDYEHLAARKQLNILMELGSTDLSSFFKKEVAKHGCVQEPARVYYWKKMLEAVDAIHKRGVIHSDIKPGNFLVVGCEVKLIDFNISNTISEKTSVTMGFDCGTINYMAPESLMSDSESKTKVTKKTDVWALGVILYYMTYGRLPLQHIKNQYKMIHAICDVTKSEFKFEPLSNINLLDTLKICFRHEQSERLSVEELLSHRYITSHAE